MFERIKLAIAKFAWPIVAGVVLLGASVWALFVSPITLGQIRPQNCAAPYQINWPATNPVWSLCWKAPNLDTVNGSGLEITNVYYKGKKVLHRGHLPVLNVKYDPGGCGGSELSYRDWQWQIAPFEADNVLQAGYAEPTVSPKTVCDNPGSDIGSFNGVAVEKRTYKLILTTQLQAGWYRYIQKWIFYPNGVIEPRLGFTAVTFDCTPKPHTHHGYWRFDFDIEGAANDKIDESNSGTWSTLNPETNRLKNPLTSRRWRVMDRGTNRGYQVIPGANDLVADAFAVSDLWALQYKSNEQDDGGARLPSPVDAAKMNAYIHNQSINGQDVVLWYGASKRHDNGIGCEYVGPTLKPIGQW